MIRRYLVSGPGVEPEKRHWISQEEAIEYGRECVQREPSAQGVMVTEEVQSDDVDVPRDSSGFPDRSKPTLNRPGIVWHSKSWQEQERLRKT